MNEQATETVQDPVKQRRERRKEKRREVIREAIIDAAMKRLLRVGLLNTTMEQVARDVDLSLATLHSYYSKNELFAAVVERGLTLDEDYLGRAFDARKSAVDELTDVGHAYLEFGIDHPGYRQLIAQPNFFGLQDDDLSQRIAARVRQLVDRVVAVIERGVDNGEFAAFVRPKDAATFLHGAWNGLLALSVREDELRLSPEQLRIVVNHGVDIIRDGLAPRGAPDGSPSRTTPYRPAD